MRTDIYNAFLYEEYFEGVRECEIEVIARFTPPSRQYYRDEVPDDQYGEWEILEIYANGTKTEPEILAPNLYIFDNSTKECRRMKEDELIERLIRELNEQGEPDYPF